MLQFPNDNYYSSKLVSFYLKGVSLFAFCFFFNNACFAIVDMKNANFSTSWTDIILPPEKYPLKVLRTYNSRTLFDGIFGFGWCSAFETKLVLSPDGTIKIIECGAALEVTYTKKDYGTKDIDNSINKLINELKTLENYSEDELKQLESKLRFDRRELIKMMLKYDIPKDFNEGEIYYNGNHLVIINNDNYEAVRPDGTRSQYNKKGRLIFDEPVKGFFLNFHYEAELLTEIKDNFRRRLLFKYDNNKLASILGFPGGGSVEYKFNRDNLISVNNAWGNVYEYEYDNLRNLAKVTWPDKTYIELEYDQIKDWVISYRDRSGCIEKYDYQSSEDDPKNHYSSIVTKTCNGKVVNNTSFEFFHKINSLGVTFMHKAVTISNGVRNELIFHEFSGKPIYISRKNKAEEAEEITYDYYPNDLLKIRTTKQFRQMLAYDPRSNKINRLHNARLDEIGNKISEKNLIYRWNLRGHLESVKSDSDHEFNIINDVAGRITSIQDKNKKMVKIEYDDSFDNPNKITLSGMSTILFSHNSVGEMNKVNSANDKSSLAIQIKNFLEVFLSSTVSVEPFNDEEFVPLKEIAEQINPIIKLLDNLLNQKDPSHIISKSSLDGN